MSKMQTKDKCEKAIDTMQMQIGVCQARIGQ